jgi:membrane-bound lytic murein transglycosylase A
MRPRSASRRGLSLFALLIGLISLPLTGQGQDRAPIKFPDTQYEPIEWADLDGWASDDHAAAFATFLASCRTLDVKQRRGHDLTAIPAALKDICERARAAIPLDEDGARKFFEDNFRPIRINKLGDTDGFLTGYYEPIITGSRVPTGEFTAPLYRRPPNLVAAGRRKLGDAFPSKGIFVGRRVGRRKIVPYYDRGQIEDGALDGWHLEICYLRDQVDVLFAQIQGSARIRLEDGTILRVNYDSHNGWPYMPVGRVLVANKIMTADQVSMQSIRDWMEANPDLAKDVRRQNKSYVFFRITDIANERAATKFDRLVIAQDTGSAIIGPARADIYFGAGDEAARIAGRIKNPGDFVMLLPNALDPVEAGRDTPLPPERPSAFSLNLGTMDDPTAPDSVAADPPAPTAPAAGAKPAITPDPAPKAGAKIRQKK